MRRYFAREPRLSREELERQAQEAIDARVALGRPSDEEFAPLRARLAEMDREAMAARQPVEPQPFEIHQVQVQVPPAEAEPEPKVRARREPVGARQSAN
jgi:hypothetical protein